MNDEKEPTTGATPEQIAAAIERANAYGVKRLMTAEGLVISTNDIIADSADFLVPPGMVLAAASDVLTPERRAAIGRAERAIRGALEPSDSPMRTMVYLTSITDADLATLREMAS